MPYTLITAKGKIYTFYVLAVAEVYQIVEGGQIITDKILLNSLDISTNCVILESEQLIRSCRMKMQEYRLELYKVLRQGITKMEVIDFAPVTADYIETVVQQKTEMGYIVIKYAGN